MTHEQLDLFSAPKERPKKRIKGKEAEQIYAQVPGIRGHLDAYATAWVRMTCDSKKDYELTRKILERELTEEQLSRIEYQIDERRYG